MTLLAEVPHTAPKVRRTVTLDADIVELYSARDPNNLSGAINSALREVAERREAQVALAALVDEFDGRFGKPSEEEIAAAAELLL